MRKILAWAGAAAFAAVFLSIGWVAGSRLGAEDPVARDIEKLRSPKVFDRAFAAGKLGESGDARAVAPLVRALRDPADAVRLNAVEALARLGGRRAVDALKGCLKDGNPELRARAAAALEGLGGKPAAPAGGNPPPG